MSAVGVGACPLAAMALSETTSTSWGNTSNIALIRQARSQGDGPPNAGYRVALKAVVGDAGSSKEEDWCWSYRRVESKTLGTDLGPLRSLQSP